MTTVAPVRVLNLIDVGRFLLPLIKLRQQPARRTSRNTGQNGLSRQLLQIKRLDCTKVCPQANKPDVLQILQVGRGNTGRANKHLL